jgi:hypothetical protein
MLNISTIILGGFFLNERPAASITNPNNSSHLVPLHGDRQLQGFRVDFADGQVGAEDPALQGIIVWLGIYICTYLLYAEINFLPYSFLRESCQCRSICTNEHLNMFQIHPRNLYLKDCFINLKLAKVDILG